MIFFIRIRSNRFGKTISVSMFAAALLYSAANVELSIYSTCKRISQKLLRNVMKFLSLIHEGLGTPEFKEVRCNMEELVLQGPDGTSDIRIVNSYPSKVIPRGSGRGGLRGSAAQSLAHLEVPGVEGPLLEVLADVVGLLEVLRQVGLGLLLQRREGLLAPELVLPSLLGGYVAHELLEGQAGDGGGVAAGAGLGTRHALCR